MLTRVLPELEKCRDRAALSAPFEVTLEEHLKQTNREIALPIELTCSWLYLNNAFADHGIFRVGGNVKTVRQLQEKIDRCVSLLFQQTLLFDGSNTEAVVENRSLLNCVCFKLYHVFIVTEYLKLFAESNWRTVPYRLTVLRVVSREIFRVSGDRVKNWTIFRH